MAADARRRGVLVMSVGAPAEGLEADLACVVDAEILGRHGEAIAARARVLLVPADLHSGGWASGRSLASWAADLPVLRQLRDEDRLVRFDLWTGGAGGVDGDFDGVEVPLRLLAGAGVRHVEGLGFPKARPAVSGFEGLKTIAERQGGGIEALLARGEIAYRA